MAVSAKASYASAPVKGVSSGSNPYFTGSSMQLSGSGSSEYATMVKQLQSIADRNNAWSAQQAQKQMDFQQASAREAMAFNHDEAELSRQWQEYMSDTAHQREVKDLQAAGLNPVLSVNGGAPVTSGATASGYSSQGAKGETDTSLTSAIVGLFGHILDSQTTLAGQALSAQTAMAQAQMYTDASRFAATTSANSAKYVADTSRLSANETARIHLQGTLGAANISAAASRFSSEMYRAGIIDSGLINRTTQMMTEQLRADTSRYGADLSSWTQREIATASNNLNKLLKEMDIDARVALQEDSQTHEWGLTMWKSGVELGRSAMSNLGSLMYLFGA